MASGTVLEKLEKGQVYKVSTMGNEGKENFERKLQECKIGKIVNGMKQCDSCLTERRIDQCICPNCGLKSC